MKTALKLSWKIVKGMSILATLFVTFTGVYVILGDYYYELKKRQVGASEFERVKDIRNDIVHAVVDRAKKGIDWFIMT